MQQEPWPGKYIYPAFFYILDDGSWLIEVAIPLTVGMSWFHVPNLLPFIFGFTDDHVVKDDNLEALKRRTVTKCEMSFEYKMDLKQVARMLTPPNDK